MKTLYLVRHAKSSWDDPSLDDIDRPLNGRGKKDAPEMGDRLRNLGVMPDVMISSPARRAFATAKRIAKQIGYPEDSLKISPELYMSGIQNMLKIVKDQPDSVGILMLFGHNPDLTEFANALCGINIYNIPTCGIVAINFEISVWNETDLKKGKLVFFDYPKKSPEIKP